MGEQVMRYVKSLLRNDRRPVRRAVLGAEGLESRIVLAAGVIHDRATRILSIVGAEGNDVADVRQQGTVVVVSLTSAAGRVRRAVPIAQVSRVVFTGLAGSDTFTNQTAIASRADGGPGADTLRGGRGADELVGGDDNDMLDGGAGSDMVLGGDGSDMLLGGSGNDMIIGDKGNDELLGGTGLDSLRAGEGDDRLDGEIGRDELVGGAGLDREIDRQDRFADGDDDGDGFDNDHELIDILYESPDGPSAYADDATVAPIIAFVATEVRAGLQLPADDAGLRVRVAREPFAALVTGTWRYLTPDKIQVWGKWAYPASDPARLNVFANYVYTGPYSGNIADYTDPANYVISEERRIVANAANGPLVFVSWLPGRPAGFAFTALGAQATGFPPAIEALRAAFGSWPGFTTSGDSFAADFSTAPGLPGVRPVVDLLRTVRQVDRAWSAQLRGRPAPRG